MLTRKSADQGALSRHSKATSDLFHCIKAQEVAPPAAPNPAIPCGAGPFPQEPTGHPDGNTPESRLGMDKGGLENFPPLAKELRLSE